MKTLPQAGTPGAKSAGGKIADIEVLRAAAIGFTLSSHLVWGLLPELGRVGRHLQSALRFWTGVDLFFAISGFVIATSLLKTMAAPPPTGGRSGRDFLRRTIPFWIRRAFRLLPSAWLWIIITLLLAAGFNVHRPFGSLADNLHEARAAFLNVANFYYYAWFAHRHANYGSFGVYWSLSLEEQFYLVLPLLLYFANRRLLIAGLAIALVAQLVTARPDGFTPGHTSLLWFVRTDALILGVLLACWKERRGYRRIEPRWLRRGGLAVPLFGVGLVLLAILPASRSLARYSTGLTALVCGLLVLVASYDRDYLLPPSRFKDALVWLGTRSYSIYLIHATAHALVLEIKYAAGLPSGSLTSVLLTLACLPLILGLAELNYRLVETRLRETGRHLATRFGQRAQWTAPAMSPRSAEPAPYGPA
jgi:peptidoglycan/LPS O-acetylase OafA/YrhL